MFSIIICKDCGFNAKVVYIKYKNCDRSVTYHLVIEEELNSVITFFVLRSVFYHAVLFFIVEKKSTTSLKWV